MTLSPSVCATGSDAKKPAILHWECKGLRESCGTVTGQGQVQDFHKDPSALQKKELQSAPVVLHPDFTLDQNSKILTLNQGQATIFGQKYTLPALPFKLPATPALNSLQSLYPSESCPDP